MPLQRKPPPKYKPRRDQNIRWNTFNGGLNTFYKPTELGPNELSQADNLMLIGKGTPTGRWGSDTFNLAGESGRIRLLDAYYNSVTSTNLLLTITDQGYMTKKNNASYTIITGASFPSGQNYQSVELGYNTYIAAGSNPFVKFDGSTLIPYTSLSAPTNVSVAQLSAASGFTTYDWLVTAVSRTGETLNSVAKSLASLPLDLSLTSIKVSWNTVSAASGVLTGYNIYRGFPGNETLIASTDPASTQYIDRGGPQSFTIFPPSNDTTGGIKAKYILKFDDRIILAGIQGDPSRIFISAKYPYHDRFTALDGGGYTLVSPNDGDDITGLGIAGNQGMSSGSVAPSAAILVFKNNSTHRITLSNVALGNFSILNMQVQLLTSSNGVSSGDASVQVENDWYYFGQKGLYSIGQEPNFLNQIRTNELSARVRPYARGLDISDYRDAAMGYLDNKVIMSFPNRREIMIYDRERAAFMGPWKLPWGISKILRYFDTDGTEKWLFGSDSGPYVRVFSPSYASDSGTVINKVMRTKKEDMGDWSVMKILKYFYFLMRNIRGQVTVNLRIEERTGNTVTTKSTTISSELGNGGWGGDLWGDQMWGQSDATIVLTGDELARYASIYKQARVVQIEVLTTASNSNFEFLGIRMTAQSLGDTSLPAADRV